MEQYHAQCTTANILTCVPACNATTHGYELLATIDGTDTKFSCSLADLLFSWIGAAALGGFIGQNVEAFISAVISGATGTYVVTVAADVTLNSVLEVRPGQNVKIIGQEGISWGPGGFLVGESGRLTLQSLIVAGSLSAMAGASNLRVSHCVLNHVHGTRNIGNIDLQDVAATFIETDFQARDLTSIGGTVQIRSSTLDSISERGAVCNLVRLRAGARLSLTTMAISPLVLAQLKDVSGAANPGDPNPNMEDSVLGNAVSFDRVSVVGRPSFGVLTGSLAVEEENHCLGHAFGQCWIATTADPANFLDSTSEQGALACAENENDSCDTACAARGMFCDSVTSGIAYAEIGYDLSSRGVPSQTGGTGWWFQGPSCSGAVYSDRRHDEHGLAGYSMIVKCA